MKKIVLHSIQMIFQLVVDLNVGEGMVEHDECYGSTCKNAKVHYENKL